MVLRDVTQIDVSLGKREERGRCYSYSRAMRVLVLGGTTFIGRRVVERLHGRGDEVLVVHRGQHQPAP